MSEPDFSTFEGRQAHIEKCELEMRESQAKVARMHAMQAELDARLQAFWMQYNFEMTTLIYRGMFDPTFCAPQANPEGLPK